MFANRIAILLLLASTAIACSSDSTPLAPTTEFASDPASAELVVSDITNFWKAYDEYRRTGSASAFQSLYLDRGSAGLKDFINVRALTASSLAAMVNAYPRYFEGIRPASTQLASGAVSQQVRAGYARLKTLYPAAVFPTVTFLIGRFSTGGTTANNRILIGTEFYSADAGVPLDELRQFQYDNIHPITFLPVIVAHEHVHILQKRAQGIFGHSTLLEQALIEGSADFVGELVSGGNINARLRDFGISHEHAIWIEFQTAMGGTDVSRWLYNQGSPASDLPGDMGYFVGYRIAEAYYMKATDKTQALKAIIEVNNASAFLTASGYSP